MQKFCISIKKALLGAFFILNSCSHCAPWQYDYICSCDPCFQCAKVYYEPQNVFREAGIEIAFSTDTGFRFFLNFYGCPIPDKLIHDDAAEVTLIINNTSSLILANVCKGGQRLILPEDASQLIIQSLLNNEEVCLKIWRYSVNIPLEGFEKNYNKIAKIV